MKKVVAPIICIYCLLFATLIYAQEEKSQLHHSSESTLRVALDWFPNPDHAPLLIAMQQGFFKAQGLNVELIGPADPNDPPKWVATQIADIAITYEPDFIEQVDQGLPLIQIGTLIDKPLDCLVALKESGIHHLSDLKGKRIGSSNNSVSSLMLKVMLAKADLTDKDVELINVRYNLTQALLSHKIDSVTGIMRNFEVPQLELTGHQVTAFFPEDYGIPKYSELIFITHLKNLHDQRLPRFLNAIKNAVSYYNSHVEETWRVFAKQYPESNNEVNHRAWLATKPYFAEDPYSIDHQEWEQFTQFMFKHRMIKKVQPLSRYVVSLAYH